MRIHYCSQLAFAGVITCIYDLCCSSITISLFLMHHPTHSLSAKANPPLPLIEHPPFLYQHWKSLVLHVVLPLHNGYPSSKALHPLLTPIPAVNRPYQTVPNCHRSHQALLPPLDSRPTHLTTITAHIVH